MFKGWEDEVFGKVSNADWIDVGAQVPTRQNDPIDGLFGDTKTDNLVARWESIASEYQIPVMAQFHGFDTEAKTTFRVPIDSHNIEKGLIKVKINQSERLRALMNKGVNGDEALYDYVLEDGFRLADQVVTRTKVAKNELMATGKVTIKENNLNLTVDYGVPSRQTNLVIDLDAEADVPAQIQSVIDYAQSVGVTITGILTSSANVTKIRNNQAIQIAINGTIGKGALVSKAALNAYLADEFGITVLITNDLTYGADATVGADGRPVISQKKYFPTNKITFFATNPGGNMGVGLWGNPPEVDMGQFYSVGGSTVSPYVFISQKMEWDPAVLWTKASGLFIPVLYNPNSLFIATVADGGLDKATIAPEDGGTTIFGHTVSDLQTSVSITNGAVTGTLKKVTTGALANDWGPGYFLALKWSGIDPNATSLLAGLDPSEGTGLVECIGDPDRNGVFKITNKNIQKFKLVSANAKDATVQTLDLSGLTLQGA